MRHAQHRLIVLLLVAASVYSASTATAKTWPSLDGPVSAQKAPAGSAALVIAIEDYAFLPDIPGARLNAADWESFLRGSLGISSVFTLVDQQAAREDILEQASRAAAAAGPQGQLWVIFIGHGAPSKDGMDGLLIGVDGQQNETSMEARGVRQTDLLTALESGPQKSTVVLLDACFSGRDRDGGGTGEGVDAGDRRQ